MSIPVVIKVLSSLLVILIISQFTRKLLISIFIGALILAVWTGHSVNSILEVTVNSTFSAGTLMLILVIFQVMWLSDQMNKTGMMKELVVVVSARVSRRMSMAIIPAIIGLLPMPGGAIFSAPLVDSCDTENNISPAQKTQINFWFRHIWEYWWPLYPGILLTMEICKIPLWQIVVVQFPITIFQIIIGYFWLLRKVPNEDNFKTNNDKTKILPLILPILIIIITYFVILISHSAIQNLTGKTFVLNKYLPMCIGIFIAMVVLQFERPINLSTWKKILLSKRALLFAGIVLAVRIYGSFISAKLPNGELIVEQMRSEMLHWQFPVLAAILILPFVCGLTTGITVGFVGASFPIVYNLINTGTNVSTVYFLSTIAVAFFAGYAGVLLSPVHVCLVVTSEHFKTRLLNNIATLALPVSLIMLATFIWRYILIALWG